MISFVYLCITTSSDLVPITGWMIRNLFKMFVGLFMPATWKELLRGENVSCEIFSDIGE